jgi:hypothetical protein
MYNHMSGMIYNVNWDKWYLYYIRASISSSNTCLRKWLLCYCQLPLDHIYPFLYNAFSTILRNWGFGRLLCLS